MSGPDRRRTSETYDALTMAEMDNDRDAIAAVNNAEWCGAVWRSHGLSVEQAHGMWFTRLPTPPFYPNAVTVDPVADPSTQAAFVLTLAAGLTDFSVKDSFARLPLEGSGFRLLFTARWLWRDFTNHVEACGHATRWRRVTAGCDLEEWELAWRGDEVAHSGVFRPELLGDPRAIVIAGTDASGAIKAGGVAYETADALGITNIFGDEEGFLEALLSHTSAKQVVCYERGEALRSAQQRHFKILGPLNVWTRHCAGPTCFESGPS